MHYYGGDIIIEIDFNMIFMLWKSIDVTDLVKCTFDLFDKGRHKYL